MTKSYDGDLSGTSVTQWVMAYAADGNATFVGIERIAATVGERQGTIVLQHIGTFDGGAATAELDIVTGSCTGDFSGLTGSGTLIADPDGRVSLDTASSPTSRRSSTPQRASASDGPWADAHRPSRYHVGPSDRSPDATVAVAGCVARVRHGRSRRRR